jgi:hypothetical protein
MKFNKWTMGLAAVGVVSLASAARADETKMSQLQTALTGTTLSGYVDASAMWNLGTQHGMQNGAPYGAPYTPGGLHGDGFNLGAFDLALDRPLDESPWAAGYHAELMFGQDAVGQPLSTSPSLNMWGRDVRNNRVNYSFDPGASLATIRQAYLTLGMPVGNSQIFWKLGVFDSPIGYESNSDPLNPNFTRSYGYSIEPATFTGLLGTYKVNDMISLSAGVANAAQPSGNATDGGPGQPYETQKAYMGTIGLTAPDSWGWAKGATLNAGAIVDDIGSASRNGQGTTWLYVGAVVPTPATALKFGAAFDYKEMHNTHTWHQYGNFSDDNMWDVALYGNYQFNDKFSLNLRGEYFDGTASPTFPPAQGHTGEEFTATASYQLWANVLSRVELRWDRAGVQAYNANDTRSEFMVAANLIYQF